MAIDYNRQYVGARYVPKFFENPNGSWDWASGFQYEPLTVVKYGSATYTSKKLVPQTIGAPNLNTDYWAQTGDYNGAIVQIQNEINDIVTKQEGVINLQYVIEKSLDLNNLIEDGSTIYIPSGTWAYNITVTKKNVSIIGNGTLKGTITINAPYPSNYSIKGVSFTSSSENFAIHLIDGRYGEITGCYFDETLEYGIYSSLQSGGHGHMVHCAKVLYNNFMCKNGIYLVNKQYNAVTDIDISHNTFTCSNSSVQCDRVDGFNFSDNILFSNIYSNDDIGIVTLKHVFWFKITDNTFFEGQSADLIISYCQDGIIEGNFFGYAGEVNAGPAIDMRGFDFSGTQYDFCNTVISGNFIYRPCGDGIKCGARCCYMTITNNMTFQPGSDERYIGTLETLPTAYGVNYPAMNNYAYGFSTVTDNVGGVNLFKRSMNTFGNNIPLLSKTVHQDTVSIPSKDSVIVEISADSGYTAIGAYLTNLSTPSYAGVLQIGGINSSSVSILNTYSSTLSASFDVTVIYLDLESINYK